MVETFIHKDFSAGWCPADDPTNGRINGLQLMNSVELDTNGALVLTGGIKTIFSGFTGNVLTLYSKFLGVGTQYRYTSTSTPKTWRDTTVIINGGSATRVGYGAYGNFVIICSGSFRIRDSGVATANMGQVKDGTGPTLAIGGAGTNTGSYNYIQLNVYSSGGAYIAKSAPGVVQNIALTNQYANVTGNNPTAPANETWIFRQGGTLDRYYRIKRLTSAYNTLFADTLSDQDALDIGIILNLSALTINSTDLPEDIIEICGPVNNRIIYFTRTTINFSEENSPESYLPGQSIFITGTANSSESFLWARKVNDNTILIGTTRDIYKLTGTYVTLPDGTLDIYYRSLGTKFPPISPDADIYNGGVGYMSHDGWRITYPTGESQSFVDDRIDRLYRGETPITGNTGIPIYINSANRYSIAIARNKLWCTLPTLSGVTFHIYDLKRNYWRQLSNVPDLVFAQEDGAVFGFWGSDSTIREVNNQTQKTDDANNQTTLIQFPIWNFGNPRNRKILSTIKAKINTGGDGLSILYSLNDGVSFNTLGTVSSATLTEQFLDLSALTRSKSIQVRLAGTVSNLILDDITIDYTPLPNPTSFVQVDRLDIPGLDGKKFRPRTWPIKIDTLGHDVTFTPIINGSNGTPLTINTTYPQVVNYFFKTDTVATDLGYKISGSNLFELYQVNLPEIVQIFPIAKQFDQIGPEEFFRYGKVKLIRFRLFSDSTANIPYNIYFQDGSITTGNLTVVANVEDTYEIQPPFTTAGHIIRIELGPTSFNFYRYYIVAQVAKTGSDTGYSWVQIPAAQ